MYYLQAVIIFLALQLSSLAYSQLPKEDKKAAELYQEAERNFRGNKYEQALEKFQEIGKRKFNLHTTPALYMEGLCHFYLNNNAAAIERFSNLVESYAQSIYLEEANYHKGLLMLRNPEQMKGGLYLLMNLAEDARNATIKQDAEEAIMQFLMYDASLQFLREYIEIVRPSYQEKVHSALCYHLYQDKNTDELTKSIEQYKKKFGQLTPQLNKIAPLPKAVPPPKPKAKVLKVAVMLSFFSAKGDSTRQAEWAIQLLEGIRYASENIKYPYLNNVEIKVVDTQKKPEVTENLLKEEISPFKPDVIIGDIFNGPSKIIAKYAETNKILQIVPLSPATDIIADKKYVYLANPSIPTQVKGIANYARERLFIKRFLVLEDNSKASELLVPDFVKVVKDAKLTVSTYTLPPNIRQADQVSALIEHIKKQKAQALYIPTNNQHLVSFLLSEFNRAELDVQILGTPDWSRFHTVSKKLLSQFNTIFPDNYYPKNDSTHFEDFSKLYYDKYKDTPGLQACQGYDIMRFILSNYTQMAPLPSLLDIMEKAPPFRGLNQNYYFAKANDNQSVQLLQYKNEQLIKIRLW